MKKKKNIKLILLFLLIGLTIIGMVTVIYTQNYIRQQREVEEKMNQLKEIAMTYARLNSSFGIASLRTDFLVPNGGFLPLESNEHNNVLPICTNPKSVLSYTVMLISNEQSLLSTNFIECTFNVSLSIYTLSLTIILLSLSNTPSEKHAKRIMAIVIMEAIILSITTTTFLNGLYIYNYTLYCQAYIQFNSPLDTKRDY